MTLAKRIRDSRYSKGWGPDELASRAQISRTALYQIESGKTETPRAGTLRRIARALGVTTDALLGNEPTTVSLLDDDSFGRDQSAGRVGGATVGLLGESDSLPAPHFANWMAPLRSRDLDGKLHALLDSPLGEGVARIIEESYRLLPASHGRVMS